MKFRFSFCIAALFAALAIPTLLAAQNGEDQLGFPRFRCIADRTNGFAMVTNDIPEATVAHL